MEINWTVLTYFVIGLFALAGFFKGWWKEAITTALLAVLVFLLANPTAAQWLIDGVNNVISMVWGWLPASIQQWLVDFLNITVVPPQINASDPNTWLAILIMTLGLSIIIGRALLPNHSGAGYAVRPSGSIFGGLVGGLNGFIIMGLLTAYLQGTSLPGGTSTPSLATQAGVATASSGVAIQAVNVPSVALSDSYLPWLIMILGLALFIMLLRSRVGVTKSKEGYRKVHVKQPYGYEHYGS